jgi:hypothetical protein
MHPGWAVGYCALESGLLFRLEINHSHTSSFLFSHFAFDSQHCVKLGFTFHFVKDDKLILSRWLPDAIPSRLPLGPTHQLGVGALVLNPEDPTQMLVVQELTGPGT